MGTWSHAGLDASKAAGSQSAPPRALNWLVTNCGVVWSPDYLSWREWHWDLLKQSYIDQQQLRKA